MAGWPLAVGSGEILAQRVGAAGGGVLDALGVMPAEGLAVAAAAADVFGFDEPPATLAITMPTTASTTAVATNEPRMVLRRLARARRASSCWRRRSKRRRASSRSRLRLVATVLPPARGTGVGVINERRAV